MATPFWVEAFMTSRLLALPWMAPRLKGPGILSGYRIFVLTSLRRQVRNWRQTRDPDAALALVADVKSNQQRRDLLQDAGILEFAAIDGAQPGNLGGQLADELRGSGIIAADDDITLDRTVAVQHLGRAVMKRSHYGYAFGDEFCSLLCGRALPYPERAMGSAPDA